MSQTIPWYRTLGVRLGGSALILVGLALLLVMFDVSVLQLLKDPAYREARADSIPQFQVIQIGTVSLLMVVFGLVAWNVRTITRRIRRLAATADRIAAGELSLSADAAGDDELAALGRSFNTMTST